MSANRLSISGHGNYVQNVMKSQIMCAYHARSAAYIKGLEKQLKRVEMEKEILKKATTLLMSGLTLIHQLQESFPVVQACRIFDVNRTSYRY